jgi:hypothetical protein
MSADMSVAPEIARLAEDVLFVPAQPLAYPPHDQAGSAAVSPTRVPPTPVPPTVGTLARRLRLLTASPERWWNLVRFDPARSVRIVVEDQPEYGAWLVVLAPGDAGLDCDCDVATMIAGEATEGTPGSAVLRPGSTRVHGQPHWLRGRGAGYSISLHARASRAGGSRT